MVWKRPNEWVNAKWCDTGEIEEGEENDDGDYDDDDEDWDGSKKPTYVRAWSRSGGCWRAELLARDKAKKECRVKWCGYQSNPEIVPESWVTESNASKAKLGAIEDRPRASAIEDRPRASAIEDRPAKVRKKG